MPFGKKTKNGRTIKFDNIYFEGIKPIEKELEVDLIRADEERDGGFIHCAMYERLLLSEIVIADLTMANANVFYELGIRHAAKPKSTILLFANGFSLPFDLKPIRAIPYDLENGKLSKESKNNIKTELINKIEDYRNTSIDSPIFQLIDDYPGIDLPHEVTESFQKRVRYRVEVQERMKHARNMEDLEEGKKKLNEIEKEIEDFSFSEAEILIDMYLSYRDVESWEDMIKMYDKLPQDIQNNKMVQEQYAFALNRRNNNGDRKLAIDILEELLETYGNSPETLGILGRIYKAKYSEAEKSFLANSALEKAIECYYNGFKADPSDYYPGINALTLLTFNLNDKNEQKFNKIFPVVKFAVERRGGLSSDDYWDVATFFELSILEENWEKAEKALSQMVSVYNAKWNLKTTKNNLMLIKKYGNSDKEKLNELIKKIQLIIEEQ